MRVVRKTKFPIAKLAFASADQLFVTARGVGTDAIDLADLERVPTAVAVDSDRPVGDSVRLTAWGRVVWLVEDRTMWRGVEVKRTETSVRWFDPSSGERGHLSIPPCDRVVSFDPTADGDRLVTFAAGRFTVWRGDRGTGWERSWECGDPVGRFTPNGRWLVGRRVRPAGAPRGVKAELVLRAGGTGEVVGTVGTRFPVTARLCLRPDGGQVVALDGMRLQAWRVPDLVPFPLTSNGRRLHFTSAAYHTDGTRLFTANVDQTVSVWDTQTWQRVARYDWQQGTPECVAVSPCGTLAAAGYGSGAVVVWDVDP